MNPKFSVKEIEKIEKAFFIKQGLSQEALASKITKIYERGIQESLKIGTSVNAFTDKPFQFDNLPATKKAFNSLMHDFVNNLNIEMTNGILDSWLLAETKNDSIANYVLKNSKLKKEQLPKLFDRNDKARKAFIDRQKDGLNLSDRVWKTGQQFKKEMESSISIGLAEGKDARHIAKDIQQYLNNPNLLNAKLNKKFADKQILIQNPGQGVYKSSFKNAMRVARSETNIAYREADYLRMQQNDFVTGQEIFISNNPRICPVCAELQGKYPKEFRFKGWHPQCRCHVKSLFMSPDNFDKTELMLLNGEDISNYKAPNKIHNLPESFTNWYDKNKEKIAQARALPYFIADNKVLLNKQKVTGKTVFKTAEQKAAIQKKWSLHNVYKSYVEKGFIKFKDTKEIEAIKKLYESGQYAKAYNATRKLAKAKKVVDSKPKVGKTKFKTAEQKADIQKAWQTRQLQKQKTIAILNEFEKYKIAADINYKGAVALLAKGNYEQAYQVANTFSVNAKAFYNSKYYNILSEFTSSHNIKDLLAVDKAVKSKLATLEKLPLDHQLNKLDFEINWVANTKKYPTWAVAKKIYEEEKAKVAKIYSPKISTAATKTLKKTATKSTAAKSTGISESYSVFEQWTSADDYDTAHRPKTGKWWNALSAEEQRACYLYTAGSGPFNRPLRGHEKEWGNFLGVGKVSLNTEKAEHHIRALEKALSKTTLEKDMQLYRGSDLSYFKGLFGVTPGEVLQSKEKYVGLKSLDEGFVSATPVSGKGFYSEPIQFKILAPKGTEGAYLEPISNFGGGKSIEGEWDGVSKQNGLGDEFEFLLNSGYTYELLDIIRTDTKFEVTLKVRDRSQSYWAKKLNKK